MAAASANFQADATNPSMLVQINATEQRAAFSFNEDFSLGNSFRLFKDHPQADKPASLPNLHAWYGQFFSAQNNGRPGTSLIEPPSRLYLKVSFTF